MKLGKKIMMGSRAAHFYDHKKVLTNHSRIPELFFHFKIKVKFCRNNIFKGTSVKVLKAPSAMGAALDGLTANMFSCSGPLAEARLEAECDFVTLWEGRSFDKLALFVSDTNRLAIF